MFGKWHIFPIFMLKIEGWSHVIFGLLIETRLKLIVDISGKLGGKTLWYPSKFQINLKYLIKISKSSLKSSSYRQYYFNLYHNFLHKNSFSTRSSIFRDYHKALKINLVCFCLMCFYTVCEYITCNINLHII